MQRKSIAIVLLVSATSLVLLYLGRSSLSPAQSEHKAEMLSRTTDTANSAATQEPASDETQEQLSTSHRSSGKSDSVASDPRQDAAALQTKALALASKLHTFSIDLTLSNLSSAEMKARLLALGMKVEEKTAGHPATGLRLQIDASNGLTGLQAHAEYWQGQKVQFARFYWTASKKLIPFAVEENGLEASLGAGKRNDELKVVAWHPGKGLIIWLKETTESEPAFPADSIVVTQEFEMD